jgi:hypothetical protein
MVPGPHLNQPPGLGPARNANADHSQPPMLCATVPRHGTRIIVERLAGTVSASGQSLGMRW